MPRPSEEPTPEQILERMDPDGCYVTADLVAILEQEWDVSRWTIQNRLRDLADSGVIDRIEHENGMVTYHLIDGK